VESSIETLDVPVLVRAAWLNQDVFDAVLLRPRHKGPVSEFQTVVIAE
jgi:hypothetical protein